MVAILQTLSNSCSYIKIVVFSLKISLKFVPKDPINNKTAQAQINGLHRPVYANFLLKQIIICHRNVNLIKYVFRANKSFVQFYPRAIFTNMD